jgi:hypothetical protein
MMLHSLPPRLRAKDFSSAHDSYTQYKSTWELAQAVSRLVKDVTPPSLPRLPIVGRVTFALDFNRWFRDHVTVDTLDTAGLATFFWGRVPINLLADHFSEFHGIEAEEHYVDLGTIVRAGGSNSSFDQDCANYLKKSASTVGLAKVGAAIVDLGKVSAQAPDNYSNQLRHAVTTNIELSDHAEKVLSVLLERLDHQGILGDTIVSCALVRPPAAMVAVGKAWFEQSNVVEMLDAIQALEAQLTNDNLPAAVNISLGTHVGPHNGDSPLEEYIAQKLVQPNKRFVVAAAGNDGGSGVAAKRKLVANEREFLSLQTGPRCEDLLIEFWWDNTNLANLNIEVSIYEPLATGGRAFHGVVKIDPYLAGSLLTSAPAGLPSNMISHSLFHANCRNNLSCIAFAISSQQMALPVLDIRFGLESAADVVVNAWIVVCEDQPQTTFIEGGPNGTVRVPACEASVLSVAGVEATGQMWEGSSRGPAAQYQSGPHSTAPIMAHLVTLTGESGTSYSSPRACADAIAALADPLKRNQCNDAIDLMCNAYGLQRNNLPSWNRRFGFQKVTV